jgi:hypothetical protein
VQINSMLSLASNLGSPLSCRFEDLELHLAQLAMKFRGTRRDDERRAIARDYAETIDRLIRSGCWDEVPPPEDQLPDDWMPTAFSRYWLGRQDIP